MICKSECILAFECALKQIRIHVKKWMSTKIVKKDLNKHLLDDDGIGWCVIYLFIV